MKQFITLIALIVSISHIHAKEFTLVFNNYPPFEIIEKEGPTGLSVNKIKTIFKNAGHQVKFKQIPWSRALKMAKNYQVDGIFSIFKTKEREAFFIYPEWPLFKSRDIIITRSFSDIKIETFDDLKKYRIGVIKDNSYGAMFDQMKLNKEYSVSTEMTLIKKLNAGHLDVIICTEQVFYYYIKQLNIDLRNFEIQPLVANVESLYFALSNKIPDIKQVIKRLNEELIKINHNESIK